MNLWAVPALVGFAVAVVAAIVASMPRALRCSGVDRGGHVRITGPVTIVGDVRAYEMAPYDWERDGE